MPTTSSSVRVDFYNGSVKNTDFYALLSDNRSNVTCSLSGSLTNVKDASLVIDLFEKTSVAKKPFPILPISSVTIEKGTGRYQYDFTDLKEYALKMMVVLNDGTNLTGKFSYGNVSDLTAYKFIYRETPDAFVSASFSKPNAVYSGSSIEVTAPMSFLTGGDAPKDARRPKRVRGSFDVLDKTVPADDNSESLKSYCPEVDYSESGVYTFPSNTLSNGYSYSCTLEAIYDDGFKPWKNVSGSVNVFRGPIITAVEAFGLGVDNLGAGDPLISSVMDVTMETESPGIFSGDSTITFTLSQGTTPYYKFTVPAKSGPTPVYNILNNDSYLTTINNNPIESTAANGSTYFAFNVTASRSYTFTQLVGGTGEIIDKVSNIFPENFVLDVNRLGPILVDNQWTKLGVVAPSRKVVLDSTLTQEKWNLIPENGYLAKCFKNEFFGTGRNEGLFEDVDTASTQFKFELSQDSGVTFSPVTSLRMKQGSVASSAAEDRAQWISLLGSTPLSNVNGIFNNIPWAGPTKLGPQQPPIYLMADCAAADSPTLVPGIFSLNGVRTKYIDDPNFTLPNNMAAVRADSTLPFATIPDRDGWLIKNGANITVNNKVVAPKVNLYYYVNPVSGYVKANPTAQPPTPSVPSQQTSANSFTLSQATGLGLYAVFNQNSGARQFPFFIAYTTQDGLGSAQTGDGDNASWYKSNVFYSRLGDPLISNGSPFNSGLTLIYTGTDDLSFRPDIPAERRVKYVVNMPSSKANAGYASEFVKLLSFQTSGNADSTFPGDYNFQLLETGMFTSHTSTGLISLTYNEYSRLVLAVSLLASGATTRPTATQSNRIRVMNKVNTPSTGETASYNVPSSVLTVNVVNSDANDKMTGVLFTSNLKSPDDSAVVKNTAVINSFTFDRTGVTKDSISVLTDTECKFKIAYNVTDDNGGSDITGLQGPVITVPLRNLPSRSNYVITNFDYKTMNDHAQSSFSFNATFNSNNSTNISGLKCYFNTTADFSSSTKVLVIDVKRSEGIVSGSDTVQSITVRLDSISTLFSSWTDLSAGFVEFVPYFTPTTGSSDLEEVPAQQTRYGIYNVLPIASVPATLEGGVAQAATTLKWTGVAGNSYNLGGAASGDLSAGIVASGSDFSYVFAANTLTAAVEKTLALKKKQTLPVVPGTSSPLFITLASNTWYGPVTDVTFTPVSVDTTTMVVTVLRGSNDTQLLTSHAPATGYNSSLLNVTANQLTKVVGPVATPLTFSTGAGSSTVQAHTATNTHTLSGETLASLLELRMRVAAGVKYTSKVGAGTSPVLYLISVSVVLPLGPPTPYRLAGAPLVTSNNKYTVINGKIEVPVSINANGLAVEGLSTVVAFISQNSNYSDSTDTLSGDGATVLAVFGPGSSRTYTVGSNASAISTTDNLAPGEVATTTSENLSDIIDDGATSSILTLALGTLAVGDATVLSFPATGFIPTAPIQIILIITTRLGHRVLGATLNYQAPP